MENSKQIAQNACSAFQQHRYSEALNLLETIKVKSSQCQNNITLLKAKLGIQTKLYFGGQSPCAIYNRCVLLFRAGNYEKCLEEIKKVPLSIDNFAFKSQAIAVECHMRLKTHQKAFEIVQQLTKIIKRNKLWEERLGSYLLVLNERINMHEIQHQSLKNELIAKTKLSLQEISSIPHLHNILSKIYSCKFAQIYPELSVSLLKTETDNCMKFYHLGILNLKWKRYSCAVIFLKTAFKLCDETGKSDIIKSSLAIALLYIGVENDCVSSGRIDEFHSAVIKYS